MQDPNARIEAPEQSLEPFRWWHAITRSLLTIDLMSEDGVPTRYTVELRQLGDRDDGEVRARLYRNERQIAVSKVPARFRVPDGTIEVSVGGFGLQRCHFVDGALGQRQLTPHPATSEGRRVTLHRRHPWLSRLLGLVSTAAVIAGVFVTLPQLVETLSEIPPIAETLGRFEAPLQPSAQANFLIGVAAALGSIERALRLRTSWLDDLVV